MSVSPEPLEELLRRPADERAKAALRLLESLDDGPDDPNADQAQLEELNRRAQSLRDGSAELVDYADVDRDILAGLATKPARK
jgi:hypothetical protein